MEQEVIADIARRVKKMSRYTETAELMAKSMVEQGYSAIKIQKEVMKYLRADKNYQKEIAENTKTYKQEIQDIIDETLKKIEEAGGMLVEEAGNMAWNNDLSMWQQHGVDLKKPNTLSQLMKAFQLQTTGELRNLTLSMGFKNTAMGKTGVLQAFQREMDLATLKVASGTFSYDVAVNDCVKRLAQSGLRSIDYASGRSYQLDTAARMCVRTGTSQLAGRITEMNLKNMNHDLVITSQHMGSRPEHVPIQNRVFSFSGKSNKYPNFQAPLGRGGAGYGQGDGIKGPNCTHNFYPYWEGDYIPPDVDPNEQYYKNTQKQRAMERGIRATKRELEAQRAIGGDTTELKAKLKKQNREYYTFSKQVGIRPKDNRLRVEVGTSDLKKTQSHIKLVKRNESRAMEEKAKTLFDVQPLEKGDTVKSVSLYKDLKNSDVGMHVLEYIDKNNVTVDVIYNKENIEQLGMQKDYGVSIGKHIFINAKLCNTKKKMVETIIHEATHIEYDIGEDKHAECVCDYYALKHRKGKLTGVDIKNIIKSVNERYPDYAWRKR